MFMTAQFKLKKKRREAATDSKMLAADDKLVTEAEREASSQVEEPETATLGSSEPHTEMETPVEASPCDAKDGTGTPSFF